jgi:hypothetical protein
LAELEHEALKRLPEYLATLDGASPLDVLPMLAPGFSFSIIWTADGEAKEFAGGLEEYHGYMRQREPDGQVHHVLAGARTGDTEVAFGRTTRHGEALGTFMISIQLDADDLISRLFAARTTSVAFGDPDAARTADGDEAGR